MLLIPPPVDHCWLALGPKPCMALLRSRAAAFCALYVWYTALKKKNTPRMKRTSPIKVMANVNAEMLFELLRTTNEVIRPTHMATEPSRPRYLPAWYDL